MAFQSEKPLWLGGFWLDLPPILLWPCAYFLMKHRSLQAEHTAISAFEYMDCQKPPCSLSPETQGQMRAPMLCVKLLKPVILLQAPWHPRPQPPTPDDIWAPDSPGGPRGQEPQHHWCKSSPCSPGMGSALSLISVGEKPQKHSETLCGKPLELPRWKWVQHAAGAGCQAVLLAALRGAAPLFVLPTGALSHPAVLGPQTHGEAKCCWVLSASCSSLQDRLCWQGERDRAGPSAVRGGLQGLTGGTDAAVRSQLLCGPKPLLSCLFPCANSGNLAADPI